ncbi:MAG: hypothetical protein R3246_14325, partial [Acidimicrobiia bacterium]|nr:hypothetical protein [Acidimicrobiia bacterium]
LTLGLAACSGSTSEATAPAERGGLTAPEVTESITREVRGEEQPAKQKKSKPKARAAGNEPAPDDDEGGPADHNTMPLDVTLNKECATPGTVMEATATTLPDSKLAFAASYADNDFVPNFTYVPAEGNPTGTFTWTWEITPAHPRGDALVTVVAAKRGKKQNRGASYEAPFVVADRC